MSNPTSGKVWWWLLAASTLVLVLVIGMAIGYAVHASAPDPDVALVEAGIREALKAPKPAVAHANEQRTRTAIVRQSLRDSTPAGPTLDEVAAAVIRREAMSLEDQVTAPHSSWQVPPERSTTTEPPPTTAPRPGDPGGSADHRPHMAPLGPQGGPVFSDGPDHPRTIRAAEPVPNAVVISQPGITIGFKMDPAHFDDGRCVISNLTSGSFVLEIGSEGADDVLIDGQPLEAGQRMTPIHEGTTIQSTRPVELLIRPGTVPEPEAPNTSG